MQSLPHRSIPARHALRVLPALMLAAFATSSHAAAAPAWVGVAAHAHDPRNAVHVGPLRAGTPVHLTVSLQVRNKAQLDALTAQLIAGTPGAKPLTSAEFAARHAPTAAQAQAVVDYLRAKGFVNVEVADNRLLVTADGVSAAVQGAFGAELHEYDVGGRSAYANVTDAKVPAQLQGIVLGVGGLQTVHLAHVNSMAAAHVSQPEVAQPQASIVGVSPTAFAAIYGAANLPVGTNATIGIVTVGSTTQTITDLKNFASKAGYPVPPVSTVTINGGSTSTSGVSEWNMDSQSSLATAGGTIKSMTLYTTRSFSDSDLSAAYNKAMSDNKAKVISVSIGGCETDMSTLTTDNQTFQSAVAQGQTFAFATGDSGAYECGASAGKAQSWPAASPYVMAIGGTTVSTNNGNTWAGETVWSCTSASTCQHDSAGGAGGGPSLTQTASTAQKNSGVLGSSTARGLPDVSFDANPSSGGLILVNGANQQWGGTSLATPIFAGLWARIQSNNGNTLAFPAATLYGGASAHPEWFHDVTSGNQGYAAATGWDYASGYGSLQVGNFATAFGGGTTPTGPAANFTASHLGPDRDLHRQLHGLRRHHQRLCLGLRRQRHVDGQEPDAHLRGGRHLHRQGDRDRQQLEVEHEDGLGDGEQRRHGHAVDHQRHVRGRRHRLDGQLGRHLHERRLRDHRIGARGHGLRLAQRLRHDAHRHAVAEGGDPRRQDERDVLVLPAHRHGGDGVGGLRHAEGAGAQQRGHGGGHPGDLLQSQRRRRLCDEVVQPQQLYRPDGDAAVRRRGGLQPPDLVRDRRRVADSRNEVKRAVGRSLRPFVHCTMDCGRRAPGDTTSACRAWRRRGRGRCA